MSKFKKAIKFLAIGYYWLCLSYLLLLILVFVAVACFEPQAYLVKVSRDGKFLAKLTGGPYQVKFSWDKPDPKNPSGIYVQPKYSWKKWLVARQNEPEKGLNARDIDVTWKSDDVLVITTDEGFTLTSKELTIDGQKISVSLASKGQK